MDYWAKKIGKIAIKHVQNTFGQFWDRFWAFLEFWFCFFFEKFREPDPPWNTGRFFPEKLPQNMSKTSLDNFGNDLGHLCNFDFFLIFSKTFDESMEQWPKKLFQKNRPKTRLDNRERFWTFLELWTIFDFFHELFLCLYLKKKSGKLKTELKFFKSGKLNSYFYVRESEVIILSPEILKWDWVYWLWREGKKNVCWVLFRKTELLIFSPENLKCTAWNTGQKNFKNINPKLVQNTFGHFWKRLRAIFENWTFFDFSETFRSLDPPWNTGHFFSKNLPQNMFKTSLDIFGNDLGHFCNFEFFLNFSKTFDESMEQWSKKTFPKTLPQDTFGQ